MTRSLRNSQKINFLTVKDVCKLHDLTLSKYGGTLGIRDLPLLESAVAQPSLVVFGRYVHETLFDMAAAYCFHLIKNHPFVDGNKRTGLLTTLTFLKQNNTLSIPNAINYYLILLAKRAIEIDSTSLYTVDDCFT
jgi:death-on-curing protein